MSSIFHTCVKQLMDETRTQYHGNDTGKLKAPRIDSLVLVSIPHRKLKCEELMF